LGFSEAVLKKTLWGDFYINTKAKKIMKGEPKIKKLPPHTLAGFELTAHTSAGTYDTTTRPCCQDSFVHILGS
jgi:hypothetical protein